MSAKEESVKGVLVRGAAVQARRMRERGEIPAEVAEARLSGPALELLETKIESSRWYPIGPFCELINLVWDVCGERSPAYMEAEGAKSAKQMFESGVYLQLDYAQRTGKVESRERLKSQAKLITSVTASLYSFLEFDVHIDTDRLQVSYRNARAFEDALIHTTVGFMNEINRRQGSKRRFRGERVEDDRVVFTMELPERLSVPD